MLYRVTLLDQDYSLGLSRARRIGVLCPECVWGHVRGYIEDHAAACLKRFHGYLIISCEPVEDPAEILQIYARRLEEIHA